MALMAWDDSLSVGIDSINDQHKKLIGLLNDLYDGMQSGKSRETLGVVLDKLIDYTKEHFAYEEEIFVKTGYKDADAHHKEHEDLVAQVHAIQERYKTATTGVLSLEAFNFLKRWVTSHIMIVDKKYAPYLIENGVK